MLRVYIDADPLKANILSESIKLLFDLKYDSTIKTADFISITSIANIEYNDQQQQQKKKIEEVTNRENIDSC